MRLAIPAQERLVRNAQTVELSCANPTRKRVADATRSLKPARLRLRTRLRVLLEKLTNRTKQAVLREKARSFIDLTLRVRNYLTHFDESEKPSIVDDAHGMYNLNQRLRALLIVLLLTYLGVPEDKVRDGVVSHLNLAR